MNIRLKLYLIKSQQKGLPVKLPEDLLLSTIKQGLRWTGGRLR